MHLSPKIRVFLLLLLSAGVMKAQIPSKNQVLWLRADKGVVTDPSGNVRQWKDQSPSKNNAVQITSTARPKLVKKALNGLPALRFDGSTSFMTCDSKLPMKSGMTIFVTYRISNYSSANPLIGGNTYFALWMNFTNRPAYWNHGASVVSSDRAVPSNYNTVTLTIDANKKSNLYTNNIKVGSGIDNAANTDSGLNIGQIYNSYFLNGDISEVIIYKSTLGKSEIDSVNNYLNNKYLLNYGYNDNLNMNHWPNYYQFFPRDKFDSALVPIDGKVITTGYDTVKLEVFRDDTLINTLKKSLSYTSSVAPFAFVPKIHAGLYEYAFKIHLLNSKKDTVVAYRKDITCGDVFLIDGQSNTVYSYAGSSYTNEYIRTFGSNLSFNDGDPYDTSWDKANGSSFNYYTICSWGIKMAQLLKEKNKMPICIINQGVGGTTVGFHLKDTTNPYNLSTNYGRMLYRMKKSGLTNNPKAICWYQGESNSLYDYENQFTTLHKSWFKDYPSLKHFYMVQVHTGCSSWDAWEVRELLRELPDKLKNGTAISTTNLPGHDLDHCHYYQVGYDSLGIHIFRTIDKDFYGSKDSLNILPPNVSKVFYTDSTYSEIGIFFREKNAGLRWTADVFQKLNSGATFKFNIKHAFYLNDSFDKVNKVTINGDTLKLKLNKPFRFKNITYIPNTYYENTPSTVWEGPWIINRRQIGALTFYHFPIDTFQPKINTNIAFKVDSPCLGQSTIFSNVCTIKYGNIIAYHWDFGDSTNSNIPSPIHKYKKSGSYSVKLKTSNSTGVIDSLIKIISINSPNAMFSASLKNGRTYQFKPKDSLLKSYFWDFGDGGLSTRKQIKYTFTDDGKYMIHLNVTDSFGCKNQSDDSLNVRLTSIDNQVVNINQFYVTPNPLTLDSKIQFNLNQKANIQLILIDNKGQLIYTYFNGLLNQGVYSLDVQKTQLDLKAGVYSIIFINNQNKYSKKVIKL